MPLSFSVHPLLVITGIVAAATFAYWSYSRTTPTIPTSRRVLLGGLRGLTLVIVLFLLFDPVFRRVEVRQEPPIVAILADNSASVGITSDSLAIRNALNTVDWASLDGEYRLFRFGEEVHDIGDAHSSADSLTASDVRTNVSEGIQRVSELLSRQNHHATVLISDGVANAGRNPAYAAEETSAPVHAVIVGDTAQARDVRIQDVLANETAYSNTSLPFSARIIAEGFSGEQVNVTLSTDGQLLDEQAVTLGESGTEERVDLTAPPVEAGLRQFVVSVSQLDGEITYRNNTRVVDVRVVDSRRNVLMIAGSPHPDVGALRSAIESDPSSELTTRIQISDDRFVEGALPASLDDVDLVVLVDFPNAATAAQTADRMGELLRASNAAVLYVAGRDPRPDQLNRLGDAALPALPSRAAATSFEAQPTLTSRGSSHPVAAAASQADWHRLPPLHYADAGWQPSADAVTLATLRSRGVDLADPLIVVRARGGRRSASILGTNMWMWRTISPTIGVRSDVFDDFVDGLIRWLTAPEDDRRVRVRPVENRFEGTQSVRFAGEVYDESMEPVDDAMVQLDLESSDGSSYQLTMETEGRGRYRLDIGALPEGTYQYDARALRDEVDLGTDAGSFSVGPSSLEYLATRADAALMRQIAARSSGTATTLAGLQELLQNIASAPDFLPRTEQTVNEASLRHVYLLLAIVIALLASEWILRKRSGMV